MSSSKKTEKMCRACLSTSEEQSELLPLFSGGCAISEVPTKIINISNVLMKEQDGLPDTICRKCVFLVKVTDCFKKQLQAADRELRKIWDRAEGLEKNTCDSKITGNSIETEIEELAYNPEYVSDGVKLEMEKVFRRKHRARCDSEFEDMSKFLKNLGRKSCLSRNPIKKEIVLSENSEDSIDNTSNFDVSNSSENINSTDRESNESLENISIASEMSARGVKIEITRINEIANADDCHKKTDDDSAGQTKIFETKEIDDSSEKKSTTIPQPKTELNNNDENVNPNIIVISDSSDDEIPRSVEKNSERILENSSEAKTVRPMRIFVRGGKRKLSNADGPTSEKPMIGETPKIQVKKIFQTVEVTKIPKMQSNIVPRTYFLCTCCNVRLRSVAAVLLHHNEVHSPDKNSLRCRMCSKDFPSKSRLLEHFDEHVETHLFRCSHCPNEFVLKENLMRHLLNHTRNNGFAESKNKRMRTVEVDSMQKCKLENPQKIVGNGDDDHDKENLFTKNS